MRINTLIINNYKNLDFDLFHKSDLIALIGNNGSGKSNTLEAISFIFRSLYVPKYELNFDYCINYTTSNNDVVQIIKQGNGILFEVNSKEIRVFERNNFLPKKVIAIYSGEETRLFDDCYGPFYREFVSNINKAQLQGTDFSELPKMLFLNRFYWNISLLCLLLSDDNNIKDFIDNKLSINRNTIKIKFDFLKRNYENYNDNQAIRLIKNLDKKTEYSLQEFKNLVINDLGYIVDEVYKYLYLAYTPKDAKVIHDIMIEFNNSLTVSDLSEGEKKLILIKGALSFAGHEDCLFLLDEPDSHVHINNKEQIINSFSDYLQNRQIVITTHSPTLTQSVKDENVYMLNNGKIIDIDRQKIIQEVTGEFWNKHQQSSFLSSEKSIFLIVEGKEDKEHLKNAYNFFKDEYENLSFDILNLGGADNIEHFIKGICTTDIQKNKFFISILDDDEHGNKVCTELNKTLKTFNNFKVIKYPKKDVNKNHEGGFTVENLFDKEIYEKAYKEALNEYVFENKSIDKISKDLQTRAKGRLLGWSKTFAKSDFNNFKFIFEKIDLIHKEFLNNKQSEDSKVIEDNNFSKQTNTPKNESLNEKIIIPPINEKEYLHHKKYTSKKTWENFLTLRESLLRNNPDINFGSNKYFISLYVDKKNIAVIRFRKKEMNIEMKSREEQVKQFLPNRNIRKRVNGIVVDNIKENDDFTDVLNMITELSKIRN